MIGRSTTSRRSWSARTVASAVAAACCLVVFACSDRDHITLGAGVPGEAGPSTFAPNDADVGDAEAGLVSYCPSNKCPEGHVTCPSSRFPCDVDLKSDRKNCGACGVACPTESNEEIYECVEGRCVLNCKGQPPGLDCDGFPDNGCEIKSPNNDHCGACGNKCSDPDKPCILRGFAGDVGCGCAGDDTYCPMSFLQCVNTKIDDFNCGACGTFCDPTGGGKPQYDNAYYGCHGSTCGHLKCAQNFGDCDDDMSNGCETSILTAENCGGCGIACAPGQVCGVDSTYMPQCMCAPGKTFCPTSCSGGICEGECFDLTSNRDNCGACGLSCMSEQGGLSFGVCSFGMCSRQCVKGTADCNGNEGDDCEVNTDSDPRNCGTCGRVCDAIAGQACVGGECVVEPCGQVPDSGPVAR